MQECSDGTLVQLQQMYPWSYESLFTDVPNQSNGSLTDRRAKH